MKKYLLLIVILFLFVYPLIAQNDFEFIVHFDFDKSNLQKTEKDKLDAWLNQLPSDIDSFVLNAHTDLRGSNGYNLTLSEKRLFSVKSYLNSTYENVHISDSAFGEDKPLSTKETEIDHAANRRVEIKAILREVIEPEIEELNVKGIDGDPIYQLNKTLQGNIPYEKLTFNNINSWEETKTGLMLNVKANSYPVNLKVLFTNKLSEMIQLDWSTTSNGHPLSTMGMGDFSFSKDIEELTAILPQDSILDTLDLFKGGMHGNVLNWDLLLNNQMAINVSGQQILDVINGGFNNVRGGNAIDNTCQNMFFIKRWFSKECRGWKKVIATKRTDYLKQMDLTEELIKDVLNGKDLDEIKSQIDPKKLYTIFNLEWQNSYRYINYDYFTKFNVPLLNVKLENADLQLINCKLVFPSKKLIFPAQNYKDFIGFQNVPEGEKALLNIFYNKDDTVFYYSEEIVLNGQTIDILSLDFKEYTSLNEFRDILSKAVD